jgi:hypothetical protein
VLPSYRRTGRGREWKAGTARCLLLVPWSHSRRLSLMERFAGGRVGGYDGGVDLSHPAAARSLGGVVQMGSQQIHSYEHLKNLLGHYTNWGGDPVPYDFNGVLGLLLALADNLRHNSCLDAYAEDIESIMSPEQAEFLSRLAAYGPKPQARGGQSP